MPLTIELTSNHRAELRGGLWVVVDATGTVVSKDEHTRLSDARDEAEALEAASA